MSTANYVTAADAYDAWRDDLLTGEPPKLYRVGDGDLSRIEVGPKLVTLFGGSPGAGKTAFTMQMAIDALRLNPELRVVVCNIEMPAEVLLDRQLARLSGVSAEAIRYRQLDAGHAKRIDSGLNTLESIADRLCFIRPPFTLENCAESFDAFGGHLLVLDYIQRIPPPGSHSDRRGSIDATMSYLRQFADAGAAVVVVAAVARQKDAKGRSSYGADTLSLASFKESGELEFGCDDAYILAPDEKFGDIVTLRHLKARHTEPRDIRLQFDRRRQAFAVDDFSVTPGADGELHSTLSGLWGRTAPAAEGGDR